MPLEIIPGELLEDKEVLALVALSAGGARPQDDRTLRVYGKLRLLGLAQRGAPLASASASASLCTAQIF